MTKKQIKTLEERFEIVTKSWGYDNKPKQAVLLQNAMMKRFEHYNSKSCDQRFGKKMCYRKAFEQAIFDVEALYGLGIRDAHIMLMALRLAKAHPPAIG